MTLSPVLISSSKPLPKDPPELVREEGRWPISDLVRPSAIDSVGQRREMSVLVVEDDAGIRNVLAYALRTARHRVSLASDGFVTLNLVRRDPPDVVLLDLGLPVLDGQEFLEVWRTVAPAQRVPVIVLSSAEVRTSLANFNVQCHTSKPFDIDQFLAAMASATAGDRL